MQSSGAVACGLTRLILQLWPNQFWRRRIDTAAEACELCWDFIFPLLSHTAQCTLHTKQCTPTIAHHTLHTPHCTPYIANSIMPTSLCTLHTAQCTQQSSHGTVNITHFAFHTEHTVHSVHLLMHTLLSTLHTADPIELNEAEHFSHTSYALLPFVWPLKFGTL